MFSPGVICSCGAAGACCATLAGADSLGVSDSNVGMDWSGAEKRVGRDRGG